MDNEKRFSTAIQQSAGSMSICEPNGDTVEYHIVAANIEPRGGSLEAGDRKTASNAFKGVVKNGCDKFTFERGTGPFGGIQYLGWTGGDINVWVNGNSVNLNNKDWADPPPDSDPVNPCVAVQTSNGVVWQCGPGGGGGDPDPDPEPEPGSDGNPLTLPPGITNPVNKGWKYIDSIIANRGKTRRPLQPGISIGGRNGAGTLGWIAEKDGDYYAVTAHHVWTVMEEGVLKNALPYFEKNRSDYNITVPGTAIPGNDNYGDWSAIKIPDSVSVSNKIVDAGRIPTGGAVPKANVRKGDTLVKSGASSQVTRGNVSRKTVKAWYGGKVVEMIEVKGMYATFGDSGAPIYTPDRRPVGILSGMPKNGANTVYVTHLDDLYSWGLRVGRVPNAHQSKPNDTLEIKSTGGQGRYTVKTAGDLIPTNNSLESGDSFRDEMNRWGHDRAAGAVANGGSDTFKFEGPILHMQLFPKENIDVTINGTTLQDDEIEKLEASGGSSLGLLALGAIALASRKES